MSAPTPLSSDTMTGWKWDITHDGPVHHWTGAPVSTPTSSTSTSYPPSPFTRKSLMEYWYVVHDGVVIPGAMESQ